MPIVDGQQFPIAGALRRVFLIALGASVMAGCAKQQAAAPPKPPTPVVIGKVQQKTMPVQVTAVGNVETISTVAIKAQVSGVLQEVRFKEGDSVHKGDVLFVIDSRPYETALAQAAATLTRDKAVAANNRLQADRYKKLLADGVVAKSDADTLSSTADAAEATVTADEAAVQTAKLNLEYCTIVSPIDGRTGAVMVKQGNLIKVADVPIVIINQVNPIYVNFTVPQTYWPDIKARMAEGSLRVAATIPQDKAPAVQGALSFVDNAVDPTTGTLHIRATFQNGENRLWPGLYVSVVLTLSEQPNSTVVPVQSIINGQNGSMVYVVKTDRTVEQRQIVSDRTVDNDAVVTKGLAPGEVIVVDGQVNLTPGAKIAPKNNLDPDTAGGGTSAKPPDAPEPAANSAADPANPSRQKL